MQVIVTGGAGFIGSNLVRSLLRQDEVRRVAVVDDLSTGDRANLAGIDDERLELHVGSVLDDELLDQVCVGADCIVHLAARPSVPRSLEDPVATHHANATGTLMVLEAARRAGNLHVVVASSSSVYGANPTLPKSEDLATAPLSPYGVSKLATETYALAYAHCFELPVLALRFFNVYGPRQPAGHAYAAAIPTFVDAALRGVPIPIDGDGGQTRDFTFVGSVAGVLTQAALRRTCAEGPVNLAFGSRRSLLEVVDELGLVLGRQVVCEHRDPRPGDVRHSQADGSRLAALFAGVEPVAFGDGLEQTVAWFRTLPEYV